MSGRCLARPPAGDTLSRSAAALTLVMSLVTLNGCAMRGAPPVAGAPVSEVPDARGRALIAAWQSRVGQHLASAGSGDPAVLSQLPALRSPAVARPGQIIFAATDVEAFVPERDGYDVFGLLLGKQGGAHGARYVFIVGAVERRDYWPAAVVDIRITAMSVKSGVVSWETGPADAVALTRYRKSADPANPLRFPAERDQFRLVGCDPGVCVEELRSGARWVIYLDSPAASASPAPAAQAAPAVR